MYVMFATNVQFISKSVSRYCYLYNIFKCIFAEQNQTMPNGQPTSFHPGAPHYSMLLWRIETDLEMECVNKTHWNILSFQERNRAFPPALETRLLCEAGHESNPYRPADDLYASSHVYCDLHEKVMGLSPPSALCFSGKILTAYPPCCWSQSPVEGKLRPGDSNYGPA